MTEQNDPVIPSKGEEVSKLAEALVVQIQPLIDETNKELAKGIEERSNAKLEALEGKLNEHIETFEQTKAKVERKYDVPGAESGDDGRRAGEHFNLAKLGLAMRNKNWNLAPFEKEVCDEVQKTMGVDPDSGIGYIVPEFRSSEIIDKLRAQAVVMQLGAREITSPAGRPIKFPKLKTDATANWIGENSSITASDLVVGQVTLDPKKLAARSVLSSELVQDSSGAADQLVEQSFVNQLTLGMDLGALNGSGGGQPIGVISLADNSVDFGGGSSAHTWYIYLNDMISELAVDNALMGNIGWAMHPTALSHIMAAAGGPTGEPDVERRLMSAGRPDSLLGYKYAITTQLPAPHDTSGDGSIILGNWDDLLIGRFSNLAIRGSDVAGDAFEYDQFQIRGVLRVDCNVAHGESFCIGLNVPADAV